MSSICRATLFDEEVRFSENIDFRAPMKEACKQELETHCKDIPHDQAMVIRSVFSPVTPQLADPLCIMGFRQSCEFL